ncbi:MAG TPA: metal-dependent hydrolase [Pirellulales bacterium]|jgi:L-ascorbate metabolism protein UlaG (beta-lactamase superfamily)|nr:metal-dependent hydrolase [Pirellulales bacterium]
MAIELTWLGHATWSVAAGNHRFLVDPYLDDNPAAAAKSGDVEAEFIFLTHGHFDHMNDAVKIAKRTGAAVVANFEICQWLGNQGVSKTLPMNIGGSMPMPFGRAKMTIAHHSSVLPDGTPGGTPGGYVLTVGDQRLYFAGDTALFSDMKMIGAAGLDLAVLPIGDLFTMGPDDSLEAVKLLNPRHVAPSHYNTWPVIKQDAQQWAERVRGHTQSIPHAVEPGGNFTV